MHVVLNHIEQCLHFIEENNGLGLWSKQAGESIHREFKKCWKKYKINIIEDVSYPERLRKPVAKFSSKHI